MNIQITLEGKRLDELVVTLSKQMFFANLKIILEDGRAYLLQPVTAVFNRIIRCTYSGEAFFILVPKLI